MMKPKDGENCHACKWSYRYAIGKGSNGNSCLSFIHAGGCQHPKIRATCNKVRCRKRLCYTSGVYKIFTGWLVCWPGSMSRTSLPRLSWDRLRSCNNLMFVVIWIDLFKLSTSLTWLAALASICCMKLKRKNKYWDNIYFVWVDYKLLICTWLSLILLCNVLIYLKNALIIC
jgi:hypothetical protein